jgi:hypothetical protein
MGFVVRLNSISEEFKGAVVWDKRCIKSLKKMAKAILKNQWLSFSAACGKILRQNGGRIFSNINMKTEKMQAGHYKETIKRCRNQEVLLCAQDTSSMNYTSHKKTKGLGLIGTTDKDKGILVHSMLAMTEEGLPLGIISQHQWTRPPEERGKKHKRKELPIEDKESIKWLRALRDAESRLPKKTKEIWIIGDRESDIYEYFAMEKAKNIRILSRAMHPRQIEVNIEGTNKKGKLNELVKELPIIAEREVEIERQSRTMKITVGISYSNIKVYPPARFGATAAPLAMSVVYVQEKGEAEDKIEWVLLADNNNMREEDAQKMLDYYLHRWKIERFHYTLKTGVFNIEKLQFDDAETLMNAIAFYSILSWRVMFVQYYGRLYPENSAEEIIDPVEKEVLEAYSGKEVLTVKQALLLIATLGGFIGGSKRYPFPGVKTIWIGLIKLAGMKEGWLLAKQHFKKKIKLHD